VGLTAKTVTKVQWACPLDDSPRCCLETKKVRYRTVPEKNGDILVYCSLY
jgi:hypothetical protein